MSAIENYDCAICTGTLRAPVKLTIFGSTIDHQCWEKHRLCLRCARKFLKMDEKKSEKFGTLKKCPFCNSEDTSKDITFLKARITYKKDKVLYKKINELIENGSLPKMICECGEEFDDEFKMEKHFKEECGESTCSCPQCNMKMKRRELEEHIASDCIQCQCGKFMPQKWYNHHIQQECS